MIGRLAAVVAGCAALAFAAPAAALELAGYDGTNPFNCVYQQAGLGTTIPHPEADPLCVEYDKTQQNLTEAGIVSFLLGEPDRFALARDKCFYVQHDHWRGSVEQGFEQSETYNWDGTYFLDRARGVGGSYVENFTVNNVSADPRGLPGFPEAYKPFFSYGRGGLQIRESVPIEPRCVEKAQNEQVYASSAPAAQAPPAPASSGRRGLVLRLKFRGGRTRGGRRCVRGGLRAAVRGRDVRRLRRVEFLADGRRVARDRRRPFSVRIKRRHLATRASTRITARAVRHDGLRLRLSRTVRRCR